MRGLLFLGLIVFGTSCCSELDEKEIRRIQKEEATLFQQDTLWCLDLWFQLVDPEKEKRKRRFDDEDLINALLVVPKNREFHFKYFLYEVYDHKGMVLRAQSLGKRAISFKLSHTDDNKILSLDMVCQNNNDSCEEIVYEGDTRSEFLGALQERKDEESRKRALKYIYIYSPAQLILSAITVIQNKETGKLSAFLITEQEFNQGIEQKDNVQ